MDSKLRCDQSTRLQSDHPLAPPPPSVALTAIPRTMPGRVTSRANDLDDQVVLRVVAFAVVIFVPPLSFLPYVIAVDARQRVGVRASACPHLHIDPPSRLLSITSASHVGRRSWAPCEFVDAIWSQPTPHPSIAG